MEGIAAGLSKAGHDYEYGDILAWNGAMELAGNWWPTVRGKPLGEFRSGEHCNSFIAAGEGVTADGGIVLAHNTWDTYIDSNTFNIVLDIKPASGASIIDGPNHNQKAGFWFGAIADPEGNPWWVVDVNCP